MTRETLPTYQLKSFDDLKRLKTPTCIIEGLLLEDTIAMIVGPSGSYKSTLAIDLAVCLQNGLPWQSRETHQSNVAIFNHEDGGGFKVRYLAASEYYGIAEPQVYWDGEVPNLLDSAQIDVRIAAMKAEEIKVVIIDTLAHAMTGADENSSKDMGKVVKNLLKIQRQLKATIVVVHHTGKDTSRGARGSSALHAAIDTELIIKSTIYDRIILTQPKQRHSRKGDQITLKAIEVPIETTSACVLELSDSSSISVGGRTLTGKNAIAWRALLQLDEQNDYVSLGMYKNRLQANERFIAGQTKLGSFDRAFDRCLDHLTKHQLITECDDVITLLER